MISLIFFIENIIALLFSFLIDEKVHLLLQFSFSFGHDYFSYILNINFPDTLDLKVNFDGDET